MQHKSRESNNKLSATPLADARREARAEALRVARIAEEEKNRKALKDATDRLRKCREEDRPDGKPNPLKWIEQWTSKPAPRPMPGSYGYGTGK